MTFLSLYHGERVTDFERGQLASSFLTLAVEILRCCARASGIPTDEILGSVAASLQSAWVVKQLADGVWADQAQVDYLAGHYVNFLFAMAAARPDDLEHIRSRGDLHVKPPPGDTAVRNRNIAV